MLNFVFHLCDLKCMWPQTAHKWKFSKYILPSDFDFSVSSFSNTNKHWVFISVEPFPWKQRFDMQSKRFYSSLHLLASDFGPWTSFRQIISPMLWTFTGFTEGSPNLSWIKLFANLTLSFCTNFKPHIWLYIHYNKYTYQYQSISKILFSVSCLTVCQL